MPRVCNCGRPSPRPSNPNSCLRCGGLTGTAGRLARTTGWSVVVSWTEPQPGTAVFGGFASEAAARAAVWPTIGDQFLNDDVLPDDVTIDFCEVQA